MLTGVRDHQAAPNLELRQDLVACFHHEAVLIARYVSPVRAAPTLCIGNITRSADHQLAIAIEDQ
jgi:hypothetical protein